MKSYESIYKRGRLGWRITESLRKWGRWTAVLTGLLTGCSHGATNDPYGVFLSDGSIDPTQYRTVATQYGSPSMIPFRFGKDWRAYNSTDPAASSPMWWERPHQWAQNATNPSEHFGWELGVPTYSQTDVGDYSSNQMAVAYVSDSSVSGSHAGVDSIYGYEQARHVIAQRPQAAWVFPNHPTPELSLSNSMQTKVTGLTRGNGAGEEATSALITFQTGEIATSGMNTANYPLHAHPFPSNLVPTDVSVTSSGEFALVTCWDTTNLKGVLAVLALGAKRPQGSLWNREWSELYPGFRNISDWTFVKFLGTIDLPGMYAPTSIEAESDFVGWVGKGMLTGINYGSGSGPSAYPLSLNQSFWATFRDGGSNASKYSHYGFAVIGSRYEHKVAIVDLTPLFQKVKAVMFNDFNSFVNTVTTNTGLGDTQWPYTFSASPDFAPRFVKTLTFDHEVTAVSASIWPDSKGLVATEDGVVHVIDANGLQSGGTGSAAAEIGSVTVGKNITSLSHMRHGPWGSPIDNSPMRYQFIAVSRGDKRIDWISAQSGWSSPQIVRTLRDSRLVDPISADDNLNHSIQLDLLDVADYGARMVRAYRYGPAIWETWLTGTTIGCGQNGTDPYEYGGDYTTPTGPWALNNQNIQ